MKNYSKDILITADIISRLLTALYIQSTECINHVTGLQK